MYNFLFKSGVPGTFFGKVFCHKGRRPGARVMSILSLWHVTPTIQSSGSLALHHALFMFHQKRLHQPCYSSQSYIVSSGTGEGITDHETTCNNQPRTRQRRKRLSCLPVVLGKNLKGGRNRNLCFQMGHLYWPCPAPQ